MKFLGSLKSGEIYVHKDRDHYLIFTYNSKSWGVKDVFVHKMYMGGLGIAKYDYEASIEKLNTTISVSGGISEFPIQGETPEDLYNKADIALYRVKNSGKDNTIAYSEK